MPYAPLKSRYNAFVRRVFGPFSAAERRDVQSFDRWFYRERGWTRLLWIFAATSAVAWVASKLPWNMTFLEAAVLFNVLVFALLWSGLSAWFGYRRFHGKLFRFVLIALGFVVLGAFVGGSVADIVKGRDPMSWLFDSAKLRHLVTAALVFGFLYVALVALIANLRNREYAALNARLEAERRQSELSRQLAESRLKMLQLQIEPHFLFNTLGSAQQLAEKGAPAAARLIADLIRFLRASTPSMRDETATLAQEASLVRAYLAIMKTRLGPRLEYMVDVPADLEALPVPPGMIITLVENALKHGIEPMPEGGTVSIAVARHGAPGAARLVITVADTGAGPAPGPASGIGLANIRERLQLLHGDRAQLVLEENSPRGFVARILLPTGAAGPADLVPGRSNVPPHFSPTCPLP